jgi:hypothetical protein
MIQTAYLSSAPVLLTGEDIEKILAASRTNNRRRGITGMLLYCDGNFLQILEGPPDEVEALLRIIAMDPRHRGIIRLFTHQISHRDFSEWAMGFRRLTGDEAGEHEGFSDILDPSFDVKSLPPSRAATLIRMFKDNIR